MNSFRIVTDIDVVPKLKWRYQSISIHVPPSDSGRHILYR